jgi:myo-inositol-hexaphosphate 3-phosphohydrolase
MGQQFFGQAHLIEPSASGPAQTTQSLASSDVLQPGAVQTEGGEPRLAKLESSMLISMKHMLPEFHGHEPAAKPSAPSRRWRRACLLLLFAGIGPLAAAVPVVRPVAETAPMLGSGDVADDTAVWVHSTQPPRSVIVGINKSDQDTGGLYAFQLNGRRWRNETGWVRGVNWFAEGKKLNNVDFVRGFPAGAERWDLIMAANRTDRSLDVFRVITDAHGGFANLDPAGRVPIGRGFAPGTDAPYGMALLLSPREGRCFAFTSDKAGRVAEYELTFNAGGPGSNRVVGSRFDDRGRPWQISRTGCEIEGIVADAARDVVYIAPEDEGIYRFVLTNGVLDLSTRVVVDRVGSRLKADVEGLTLYLRDDDTGYLLASSQGSDRFVVYERAFAASAPNVFVGSFTIGAGNGSDAVQGTDGIDVVSANLGGRLSEGLFIVHDGEGKSPTNYKLVPWADISAVLDRARKPNASRR